MPSNEDLGEHQRHLGLPEGLKGDAEVFVNRFTGEIFEDYK